MFGRCLGGVWGVFEGCLGGGAVLSKSILGAHERNGCVEVEG